MKSSPTESTGSNDPAENGGLFEKGKLVEFLFRVVSCNEKGKVKKYGLFTIIVDVAVEDYWPVGFPPL